MRTILREVIETTLAGMSKGSKRDQEKYQKLNYLRKIEGALMSTHWRNPEVRFQNEAQRCLKRGRF